MTLDQHPAGQDPVSFSRIVERPQAQLRRLRVRRYIQTACIALAAFVVVNVAVAAAHYGDLRELYARSVSGKERVEAAQHQLINREFTAAAASLHAAHEDFTAADVRMQRIKLWRYYPYLGTQIRAVAQLLTSGKNLTASGERVALLLEDITKRLQNESVTLSSLSDAQKLAILQQLIAARPTLVEIQREVSAAVDAFDAIPERGLIPQLSSRIDPLRSYVPAVRELVDQFVPIIDVFPKLVGADGEQRNYLFLIQNNSELRPTGGFIGTYGILKLKGASIVEFKTDNIYNIDRPAAEILADPTPWQLRSYLEQRDWGLRDINWDPDFPSTAQKAIWTYQQLSRIQHDEVQKNLRRKTPYVPDQIHGVIAITPEPVQEVLKLTGPIVSSGILFTDENLKDELEYRLGMEYRELGISEANRKEVIRTLADQMQQRLFALPYHRLADVLQIGVRALAGKQVQLYSTEADLQRLIADRGWGGAIDTALDTDYLMVVDTNLGSLKTDPYVDRFIGYRIEPRDGGLVATATIRYVNRANFTWKTTRLRNYMRLYVPAGSELISASGAMEQDKVRDPQRRPGKVDVVNQHDKAVFGAFVSIEPGEEQVLTFTYRLPDRLAQQVKDNAYSLLVQKQSGVYHYLTLHLDFGTTIASAQPPEAESSWFDSAYDYTTQLESDRRFTVRLR